VAAVRRRDACIGWPGSREFYWAGGVIVPDMFYSQSMSAKDVSDRANLRVRISEGGPAPSNLWLKRTAPRCALRGRLATR